MILSICLFKRHSVSSTNLGSVVEVSMLTEIAQAIVVLNCRLVEAGSTRKSEIERLALCRQFVDQNRAV
jgi:hypothetical protein